MKSEIIGQRIAKILKDNRYSQRQFAAESGYTQSVISEILSGKREIDKLINIVIEKFNVSRDYLITGNAVNDMELIANYSISPNGLTKEEKQHLFNNLEGLYSKHKKLLEDANEVMKEIAAINKLLILGTNSFTL